MIIDSHCHLTYEPMSKSLQETIRRANRDGVKYMLTISTEDKSFNKILKIVLNLKLNWSLSLLLLNKYFLKVYLSRFFTNNKNEKYKTIKGIDQERNVSNLYIFSPDKLSTLR